MALPVRKGYKGAPAQAVLTNSPTNSDTSFVVDTVTGWATTFPFYCVVDPGTSKEEKVKVTAISTLTLTVVRAQDDTSAQGHNAGAAIYPVFTADEADEANLIASVMTTKGDVVATDGSTINRLGVGTNTHVLQADSTATNGFKWGQVATAGIADSAVTLAKLAATLQAYLVPVGSISAYAGATAPTGWLLCNGTSTTGYTALAALVGATTPDMRGLFPIGKTASSTGSTLLGTGGSTTITTNNMPSHGHTQDAHNHTQDAHNHTQNSHNHTQDSHNHTQDSHGHTQDSHNHTQDAHSHSIATTSVAQGASSLGLVHGHTNTDYVSKGTNGQSTETLTPPVQSATATNQATTATNQATTATNQATTATNQSTTATNIANTATNQATTATNQNTGGGTAYFQPFIAVNYIIKHD